MVIFGVVEIGIHPVEAYVKQRILRANLQVNNPRQLAPVRFVILEILNPRKCNTVDGDCHKQCGLNPLCSQSQLNKKCGEKKDEWDERDDNIAVNQEEFDRGI